MFKPLGSQFKIRSEAILNAYQNEKANPKPQKKREQKGVFYMPNLIIRGFLGSIKKRYGIGTANNVLKIMAVLSSHADGDARCWPSITRIMSCACISNRNKVISYLRIMDEELNMIKRRVGKGNSSTVYIILRTEFWKDPNGIISEKMVTNAPSK